MSRAVGLGRLKQIDSYGGGSGGGMSSWDKVVKGATKSKAQPPKAKYIDPIVSATNNSDGTALDIFRALQSRLRDPNSVVVFKALIVVHTLVRSGNKENVLGYLSGSKILGLENVVSGHDTAQNLNKYATYLDRRIRTFGALKYDIIRDKAEKRGEKDGIKGCNRLRTLVVDKGLLREVTLLQKEMDTLADCKFYLDDLDDDVVMTALRLCVKDLLLIFQAVNEGVINVLENYFEMSHPDATTALKIYKRFCTQTEKVVTYLSVAKKMQNIINVPIPNLKHAPVSLAKSLEEYLSDPNFEKNREEYKQNKAVADGRPAPPKAAAAETPPQSQANGKAATPEPPKAVDNRDFLDFFSSIEQEQQPMFPQAGQFYQAPNPFLQQQFTGFPMQMQMQAMPLAPQITGFAPGGLQQPNPFLQQQPTGFGAPNPFMQSQPTGYNPFMASQVQHQSVMGPQMTGGNPFRHSISLPPSATLPMLSVSTSGIGQQPSFGQPSPFGHRPSFSMATPQSSTAAASPFGQSPFGQTSSPFASHLARASSVPVPAQSTSSAVGPARATTASPAPLTVQPTGSRNPFAPPPGTQLPPKVVPQPTGPSLGQMAFDKFQAAQQQQQQPTLQQPNGLPPSSSPVNQAPISRQLSLPTGGMLSSVASSFALGGGTNLPSPSTSQPPSASPFAPGGQANGAQATAPLQQQRTGFGGSLVRPFKPSSSFGTSLAESLPPIPEPHEQPNPFRSATMPLLSGQTTGVSSATGSSNYNSGTSLFGGSSTPQTSLSSQTSGYGANSVGGLPTQSSFGTYPFGQQSGAVGTLI